jgi:hypothetical protein
MQPERVVAFITTTGVGQVYRSGCIIAQIVSEVIERRDGSTCLPLVHPAAG